MIQCICDVRSEIISFSTAGSYVVVSNHLIATKNDPPISTINNLECSVHVHISNGYACMYEP